MLEKERCGKLYLGLLRLSVEPIVAEVLIATAPAATASKPVVANGADVAAVAVTFQMVTIVAVVGVPVSTTSTRELKAAS